MEIKIGYYEIDKNYGYYLDKAPQNVLNELGKEISYLQNNFNEGKKFNDMLAGEIEHEYALPLQDQTYDYIKDLTYRFETESGFGTSIYETLSSLTIDTLWVNFQKKHEYNPPHIHSGIYSIVIWYKIPYFIKDEEKYNYKTSQSCNHGRFAFLYPTPQNFRTPIQLKALDIDKTKEGYVAIFPSNLNHMVYPFYSSNEYRITISGNVRLSNNKK